MNPLHLIWHYLLCIFLLLLSPQAESAFENIGIMARPMGMGGAYSAVAHDTSAIVWNPAGLAQLSTPEISVSYLELYGLLGYSFVGWAHPIRPGQTVGAAILSSSDTEGISQERTVMLSAAVPIVNRLRVGVNAKYFSTATYLERMPLGRGVGWGLDLGIHYALLEETVAIGVMLPNLVSQLYYRREAAERYNESLIAEWRIGCAIKKWDALIAAIEIANGNPLIGCEYQHDASNGTFTARVGWRWTQGLSRGLTAGFGYQYSNIALDYAFVSGGYAAQTSLFSVRLSY